MLRAYQSGEALCLALDIGGPEPPKSFTILAAGTTDTSKGTIVFDAGAASAVAEAYSEHGQSQLPIDYNHGMLGLIATPESSSAAGWFTPTVTEDGALVASEVQWTPRAAQKLREREYRYFSPALHVDPDTGQVRRLVNVALTNLPATKGQKPLVAHQNNEPGEIGQEKKAMKELLKLLGANDEAEATVIATEWNKTGDELLKLTGTKTLADAMAAVAANAELPAKVAELSDALAEREKADAAKAKDALIAKLSESGKLPPALREWAKSQTVESLEAFGEAAPVLGGENHTPPEGGTTTVSLTDEDRAVMKHMGVDEAEFVKIRSGEQKRADQ